MAGRDAMVTEIARAFPDSEMMDTWVWFQSGLNTDGAHNPVTEVAIACGFNSATTFSKRFRDAFGTSPHSFSVLCD